jgi:hypothetical protein
MSSQSGEENKPPTTQERLIMMVKRFVVFAKISRTALAEFPDLFWLKTCVVFVTVAHYPVDQAHNECEQTLRRALNVRRR